MASGMSDDGRRSTMVRRDPERTSCGRRRRHRNSPCSTLFERCGRITDRRL